LEPDSSVLYSLQSLSANGGASPFSLRQDTESQLKELVNVEFNLMKVVSSIHF
jgi:hypothetical protein